LSGSLADPLDVTEHPGFDFLDQPWAGEALCAQIDPVLWFPLLGATSFAAKRICLTCPVRTDCLEWALATRQAYGVWGGLSTKERDEEMRARRMVAA
jgi:WhiB family redox-sensing transcriptional regulator